MRVKLAAVLLLMAGHAQADSVSVNGFSCSTSNENPFEIRAYVDSTDNDSRATSSRYGHRENHDRNDNRIGLSFSYEFGSEAQQIDCNKLYELELRRLQLDIDRLEKLQGIEPTWAD